MVANGNGNARRRRARRNGRQTNARARANAKAWSLPGWLAALLALGAISFVALIALAVVGIFVYRSYADDLVAPDELLINQPSFGAEIYDRNGVLLYEYVDDRTGLRRPVKLASVSPHFLAATISTEDDSFFRNPGVNIRGLLRAVWENTPIGGQGDLFSGSGGSSITQQLVKNVYIAEEERQKRSINRKLKETVFALELTQRYDKGRILEWYVNQISYGGVYNGVEAASQGYFGKPALDLTLAEAALLAGIPQSPAAYDPVNNPEAALLRRDQILDLMGSNRRIQIGEDLFYDVSRQELATARAEPVEIEVKRFPIAAPHFVLEYVQPQLEQLFGRDAIFRDGLVVTTTLDLDLQERANAILEAGIQEFEEISNSRNGANVVIDPQTGEILVMIGSRDYFREDIEGKNNNATALNSPGSAFKPFVYLTSFLKLGWGPGTVVLDTPITIEQPDGTEFTPTNPGKDFQGPITIRNALGNSLNIPAIKVAQQVGVHSVVAQAKKMGFTTLTGGYGPAIATGGVDLTPLDMVFGYSVFANGGLMNGQEPFPFNKHRPGERTIDPIALLKVVDVEGRVRFDVEELRRSQRIVEEEYAYLITDILKDASSQCITFGCGGISVPGMEVATKTGTSEPFDPEGPNAGKIGDTWGFGYTPDIVVGVWAGNANNAPIVNIFSTSISFRVMRNVLLAAYDGAAATPFTRPASIVEETVCVPSGLKPTSLCGRTTTGIFVEDSVPTQDDDWWQRIRIDARNGLLAALNTPRQYVQERIMLVPPAELMRTEEDRVLMQEWAKALNLPLAPTETSSAGGFFSDLPVLIFSPAAGETVSGTVRITGRATARPFESYRLQYGAGQSPRFWSEIEESRREVESGRLGRWDTDGLETGIYTIRLVVEDRRGDETIATVIVFVGNGDN